MKFELFQDENEAWCWRLRDESERVVAICYEAHSNKKHAYAVIDAILQMDKAEVVDVWS